MKGMSPMKHFIVDILFLFLLFTLAILAQYDTNQKLAVNVAEKIDNNPEIRVNAE